MVLAQNMVLAQGMILAQAMVSYVASLCYVVYPCFGVYLCYGVSQCYCVSPCYGIAHIMVLACIMMLACVMSPARRTKSRGPLEVRPWRAPRLLVSAICILGRPYSTYVGRVWTYCSQSFPCALLCITYEMSSSFF